MARKTYDIVALKAIHERMTLGTLENAAFVENVSNGKAMRSAANIMLETVLHETGNYKGFQYLLDHKIDDTARHYY